MKIGKISEPILKRSVIKIISKKNDILRLQPEAGADGNIVNISNENSSIVASCSSAGLFMSEKNFAEDMRHAVINAANNVAVNGGKPGIAIVNIMMPERYRESKLKMIMQELRNICDQIGMIIAGGNTEVSKKIDSPIMNVTVIGELIYDIGEFIPKAGMDIVMTKEIAIAGTAIIALEKKEELENIFQKSYIKRALECFNHMSILKDSEQAYKTAPAIMHDAGRGGIFAALWELSEKTGKGVTAEISRIPVRQESIELCEKYGLNPYKLISDGSLLIVCEDGEKMVDSLISAGIGSAVIGKLTDDNDKIVIAHDEKRYLEPTKSDDIYMIL